MSQLKLFLFGAPRLEQDGRGVEISLRKAFALLIYLAVTKQPHSRDALATLLWPESDQRSARASLRRTLYWLNQALGDGTLAVESENICIDPQAEVWLDIDEYQRKLDGCLSNDEALEGISSECLERLEVAASLYTGEFIAGFTLPDSHAFDEWQFFEGESLRQAFVQVLVRLVQVYAARDDYNQSIQYARRWVALDPLNEPAHRQLMQLYARAGQNSAAIHQFETLKKVLGEELGVRPDPETNSLFEQIRLGKLSSKLPLKEPLPATQSSPAPQPAPLHNLPSQLTSFVGRQEELRRMIGLLNDPACRLISVIGPGGIGKTRLAIQTGFQILEENARLLPDGVCFVPLDALNSAESIVPAIAKALNFTSFSEGDRPRKQLLDFLRQKQMLLILDNFEHLLDKDGIQLVVDFLAAAPQLKIIVTSRLRLNIHAEQVLAVSGMPVPETGILSRGDDPTTHAAPYGALELFQQSARRVQPEFELTPENLAGVVRVCQLVQGMPLGIELAAAWIEVLSPAEIANEIEHSLNFLETDWQDVPERQRSLRAVFEASWRGLTEPERDVFKKLAVFQGGFRREAAQEIAGASLKMLLALTNKSWLQRTEDGRYQVHELLRQYVREELQATPAVWQAARGPHCRYYMEFVLARGELMKGQLQPAALDEVAAEFQNIQAAWQTLLDERRFDLMVGMLYGLVRFCTARVMVDELWLMLETACQVTSTENEDPAAILTACIFTIQSWLHLDFTDSPFGEDKEKIGRAWRLVTERNAALKMGFWRIVLVEKYAWLVDRADGLQKLEELVAELRQSDDRWLLGYGLVAWGTLLRSIHQRQAAKQALLEALSIYRGGGAYLEWSHVLRLLGALMKEQQSYEEATSFLAEAGELALKANDDLKRAEILWELAHVRRNQGDFDEAFRLFREQRRVASEAGLRYIEARALSTYSIEATRYGNLQKAKEARRESLAISQEINDPNGIAWSYWEMGEIFRLEGDLDTARQWYSIALELFQNHQVNMGIAFYHRGLGDIALTLRNYLAAQEHFHTSLQLAQAEHYSWSVAYASIGMGLAASALGEQDSARRYFQAGLRIAIEMGNHGLAMKALQGFSGLCAAQSQWEKAAELAAFVANQYLTWRETRAPASALLAEAASHLPAGAVQAAIQRGQAGDSLAVALKWLEQPTE